MSIRQEPSADVRQVTGVIRQFYVGLRNAGFARNEALSLTGMYLAAMMNGSNGDQ